MRRTMCLWLLAALLAFSCRSVAGADEAEGSWSLELSEKGSAAVQARREMLAAGSFGEQVLPGAYPKPPPTPPRCTDPLCKKCPVKPGVCTSCVPVANGFPVSLSGGKCVKCTQKNCVACSQRGCTACKAGFDLKLGGVCVEKCRIKDCKMCEPNSKGLKCIQCAPGYAASKDLKSCTKIPLCLVANCKTCKPGKPRECMQCKNGRAPIKNICRR